ncbi:hypothetical protein BHM03_00062532 [Ensete ventricosum]|nr:hypothetical protein BHM03_00062532 [Ensete ventricosum]
MSTPESSFLRHSDVLYRFVREVHPSTWAVYPPKVPRFLGTGDSATRNPGYGKFLGLLLANSRHHLGKLPANSQQASDTFGKLMANSQQASDTFDKLLANS